MVPRPLCPEAPDRRFVTPNWPLQNEEHGVEGQVIVQRPPRTCHQRTCVWLQHARDALASSVSCEHCARLSKKTRRRRLARQASLTEKDPVLGATIPLTQEPPEEVHPGGNTNPAETDTSWGSQMEDLDPLFGSDELEAGLATEPPSQDDYSDSDDELISLSSDVADADVEQFTLTQAERPCVSAPGSSGAQSPSPSQDLHQVCRRAAEKLGLKWPEAPAETARSRYEGRRLPTARSSAKQLLPVFPECLEEATQSWSNPLTAKTPAQGGAVLDWDGMEEKGFSHLPPIEPLVASHLYPRKSMTAAGPALPSKADCLQTTLTEKSYKAVATSMRALNASSMLLAYQAELQDDMNSSPDPVVWDELCVVTDLCLRLHRCAVQACGRAMGVMVTQERARWLNLSSLSHREKTQLLDVPVDPKGLFGSAVATMQQRCEEKKREGEALRFCLPRKEPPSFAMAPRQAFPKQHMTRPAYRTQKRQMQPQVDGDKPPELKGAWARKPFVPKVTPGTQQGQPATQGAKKKKRAT
ncbi:hypothetical protein WMY93_017781 [Mugilogobius chulae]|uniref:Uncharacterized protein n=1 Tax=Mugilogobius chulae TaxID=88201 RepID=A0AAW0NTK1_9GOBI